MYNAIINLHVWSSAIFVLVAIIVCIKSINGIFNKKSYTILNTRLEITFIVLLYIGLILGIILYFFLNFQNEQKMLTLEEARENAEQEFWAIEHFCTMLISLIFAQIGKIFTGKKIPAINKFKYAAFYYGIATLITFISTGMYILHKYN